MHVFQIVEATLDQMPLVRDLFLEYAQTLDFNLCFQNFDEELASLPGDYAPSKGCILIAFHDSLAVGCVALRPLGPDIAEMKRLYVKQTHQGQGIGRALATLIIERAVQTHYKKIRLDTVPSMKAAINMYKSMDFYPIAPYRENPVAGTCYLEKRLATPS